MPASSEETLSSLRTEFRERVANTFGADGRLWLNDLPRLLKECERRWGLEINSPITPLSYNFVAPARMDDGQEIIIKLGVPNPELSSEIAALQTYDSRGSVSLIDADPQAGVLLLERLIPGRMLSEFGRQNDEEAARMAARVMKKLWRPLPGDHGFTTVAQWAKGFQRLRDRFNGGTGPFPAGLVSDAEEIYQRLTANSESEVLLHGDLHHFNILSAQREPWLAIDPKGVAGDPAYDAGALLRNPFPEIYNWSNLGEIQSRRLDILSEELQLSRQRIQEWAYAQMVLSAWWSFEDEGITSRNWIPFAEQIRSA
ncbi:MAG: aminoglycoside phosphotransferase family protein [Candidatus Promineifilaceae bacterium]